MTVEKETDEKNSSIFTLISYSIMTFAGGTAFEFIGAYALYFYEVEVGLPIILYTIAYLLFTIWKVITDPLVGYYSDKPHFYTKRWGRRFPLILLGFIPVSFTFLLVFMPPEVDPNENSIILFFWFLFTLCAFSGFFSLGSMNHKSLFPQKFRSNKDRRYATGFNLVFWALMQFFGVVVPPLLIIYGDKSSFLIAALLIVIVTIPSILIGIPGCREDPEMIEDFLRSEEKVKDKKGFKNFINIMKKLFKNRNFLAILVLWSCVNTYNAIVISTVIYYTRYILMAEEFWTSIILLGYLVTGLITIPLWIWIIGKIGEIKTIFIGVFAMALSMLPILLVKNVFAAILASALIGVFVCALQCADEPLFATVVDQVVVKEQRRTEGAYHGILSFILRAVAPASTILIAITHMLTNFDPDADIQTPLAQWGILVDMALIPIILALIGAFAFWKLWNISEQERLELRTKLREIKL